MSTACLTPTALAVLHSSHRSSPLALGGFLQVTPLHDGPQRRMPSPYATGGASAPTLDASLRVKLMLAEGSGRLDLSECGLTHVPAEVWEIDGLEDLSLAGNLLTTLPPDIQRLTSLKRLQLSGNMLRALPEEMGALVELEGLWAHSNQLEELPATIGELTSLTHLALASNRLTGLPDSIGRLAAVKELSITGNRLEAVPDSIGELAALEKLGLHGNLLAAVPPTVAGLDCLKELWLQGNPRLSAVPPELGRLPALEQLSLADCALRTLPVAFRDAPALKALSLYGNVLEKVPTDVLEAASLGSLWLEGNPLGSAAATALLHAAAATKDHFRALGMDTRQVAGVPPEALAAAGGRLKVSEVCGMGPGYFKMEKASGTGADAELLVVAFGSAPGVPNWGGLLNRMRKEAAEPAHAAFDVLYVVDPHRSWYCGLNGDAFEHYAARLHEVTKRYRYVVMIGDSMGATGAMMFAGQATAVHAFCPQIEMASCSIRPAHDEAGWAALQQRVLQGVEQCPGRVTVHVGNWKHDLHQANTLPRDAPNLHVQIYSVDSHRLALAMDRSGKLLPTLRSAILNEMGLTDASNVRIANFY